MKILNDNAITVLSLFDGMSCGQIALRQLGVPIKKYYASEIDKFAIQQTQHNFPNTIQLGDVENWRTWDIDWKSIDLVLAGSPCQGFSFAGKQLAFDDPRSKLFFVFVDILNHIKRLNPDVKFLLENVDMKRSHMRVISDYCGVFPVNINSNLVSAQNRNRWYWTNVKTKEVGLFGELYSDIPQPKDRRIFVKDVFDKTVDDKYYYTEKALKWFENVGKKKGKTMYIFSAYDKFPCILKSIHKLYSNQAFYGIQDDKGIRFVTERECSLFQTIPDWYEWVCSKTQQYIMCGNGWTIEVIMHILYQWDLVNESVSNN